MSPWLQIALLWLGFGGSHILLSSNALRPKIADRVGAQPFLGLYSLVAFVFFVPLVSIYMGHRHEGAWLWTVTMTPALLWLVYGLMTVGVLILVAGAISPSPTSMTAGEGPVPVKGIHRITRHPVAMGLGWIGLVHLVANASPTDAAFFLGFAVFAVAGSRHQELRMRATRGPEFAAYLDATPFLPFTGSGALRGLSELPPLVWAIGIGVSLGLRLLHAPLFG